MTELFKLMIQHLQIFERSTVIVELLMNIKKFYKILLHPSYTL
jgi:hypothetical protein